MERYCVGLFDDHPIVLSGLDEIISKTGFCDVVATGSRAEDALDVARDRNPDLVILDLQMPGDVIGTIAKISAERKGPKVLVFTASEKASDCVEAMSQGANGYVVKGSDCGDLFDAIRVIMEGGEFISPKLAVRVIREMNRAKSLAESEEITLSCREDQIVSQLLKGASNRDIAEKLKLSEKTVKYYMTQIMQKFDVKNRVEVVLAVQKARSH